MIGLSRNMWVVVFLLAVGVVASVVPWTVAKAAPPGQGEPVTFDGVEFPHGEISFADRVVSYKAGEMVESPYANPENVLGTPDFDAVADTGYVAMGNATEVCQAELILEFRDNALVDIPGDDLWIFEIGPAVEATDVYISADGQDWVSLGRLEGATRGMDIADETSPGESFNFVKLCDYPDGASSYAPWGGPDIDAVGAIGTQPQPTPTPAPGGQAIAPGVQPPWCLLGIALLGVLVLALVVLLLLLRRRKGTD